MALVRVLSAEMMHGMAVVGTDNSALLLAALKLQLTTNFVPRILQQQL